MGITTKTGGTHLFKKGNAAKEPLFNNCCPDDIYLNEVACVGNLVTFVRNDGMTFELDLSKVVEGSNVTNFELLPDNCTLRITTDQAAPSDQFDITLPGLIASGSLLGPANTTIRLVDSCGNDIDIDISGFTLDGLVTGHTFGTASTSNILRIITNSGNFDLNVTNMLVDEVSYDKAAATLIPVRPDALAGLTPSDPIHHTLASTAWVDLTNGDDGTGALGREDCPFLTVHAAVAVLAALGISTPKRLFVGPGVATYQLGAGGGTDDTAGGNSWVTSNLHTTFDGVTLRHLGVTNGGSAFFDDGVGTIVNGYVVFDGVLSYLDTRPAGGTNINAFQRGQVGRYRMVFQRWEAIAPISCARWRSSDIHIREAIFNGQPLDVAYTANLSDNFFRFKVDRGNMTANTTNLGFMIEPANPGGTATLTRCHVELDISHFEYGRTDFGVFRIRNIDTTSYLKIRTRNMRHDGTAFGSNPAQHRFLDIEEVEATLDIRCMGISHPGSPLYFSPFLVSARFSPKGTIELEGTILDVVTSTAIWMWKLDGRLRVITDLLFDFTAAAGALVDGCFYGEDSDRRNSIEGSIRHIIGASATHLWHFVGTSIDHIRLKELTMETDDTDLSIDGNGFAFIPLVYVKDVDANVNVDTAPVSPATFVGPHTLSIDPAVQA